MKLTSSSLTHVLCLNRCRYYGQRLTGDAGDELDVFVEQKTHRDKDVGETSFKVC